jgi:hypothetical protein
MCQCEMCQWEHDPCPFRTGLTPFLSQALSPPSLSTSHSHSLSPPISSPLLTAPAQVAGLTSMLSAKGRVCNNKVVILDKMTTLRNKLKGYIDEGEKKVKKRETDTDAAKQAWLDEEGAYLIAKSKAESLDKQVAEDLKKVTSLTELLDLNKKRLAKVRASVTEQLSEIDEEEAIIRELLGYIGDLTKSTVDVVRAERYWSNHTGQIILVARAPFPLISFACAARTFPFPRPRP